MNRLRSVVSTLWPRGQIPSAACFCVACGLNMDLTFLNGYRNDHIMISIFAFWPTKPKIDIVLLFTEKVCQPLVKWQAGKIGQTTENKGHLVRHLLGQLFTYMIATWGEEALFHQQKGSLVTTGGNWRFSDLLTLVVCPLHTRAPVLPYQCLWCS